MQTLTADIPETEKVNFKAIENLASQHDAVQQQLAKAIVGQTTVVENVLLTIFCGGHALIIGVPGLAKTLLINSLAKTLALSFKRIQFTPDLMPSDITGTDIIEEDPVSGKRRLEFLQGPVFANLVLADEINRTPPKTQAAMLQTMQEHEVTVGTKTYALPTPFHVQHPLHLSDQRRGGIGRAQHHRDRHATVGARARRRPNR